MNTIKPTALRRGDTVALICPASRPFEPGKIAQSVRFLEQQGFNVQLGDHVLKRNGNFAGTDEQRLEDFHRAWAHPDVKAVICERGGNGAARLLPYINYDLIRNNPKILIGYSDITALHLAIHKKTGLVTLHGPVAVLSQTTRYTCERFIHALTATAIWGDIPDPQPKEPFPPVYPPYRAVVTPGRASGTLIGGNMTLIRQLMSTPYEIDTGGKILFLEDIDEEPFELDAIFTQLIHAGKLQQAAAIIVGACAQSEPKGTFLTNFSLEEILEQHLGNLGVPVVYGMRIGHTPDQCVLPIGIRATLDASTDDVRLAIEETVCQ
jgi:muramoyltetrapeptide carboxypeptidase